MTGFMVQINNFPFTMDLTLKVLHKKPEFGNFFALFFTTIYLEKQHGQNPGGQNNFHDPKTGMNQWVFWTVF
jgi:hypothetical protein